MNARLDMLVPPAAAVAPAGEDSYLCCPAYVAGRDAAPDVFADLLSGIERLAVFAAQVLRHALERASYPRC